MSEVKQPSAFSPIPLADGPAQQAAHARILAEREARNQREAEEDAARKAADDAADAAEAKADADAAAKSEAPAEYYEPLSSAATIAPAADAKAEAEEEMSAEPPPAADLAAEAAERAEADKQHRAENGLTGAANGDPAALAFGARIAAAKFEHRNQGHDATMDLLDEMVAAMQRLEAKLAT